MKYLVKVHVRVGEIAFDMSLLNAIARIDPDCHLEVLATSPTHQLLEKTPFIERLHVRTNSFFSDCLLQLNLLRKHWDVVLVTRKASRLQLFYHFAQAKHKRSRKLMDISEEMSEMEIRVSMLDGILSGWEQPIDPTIHFDLQRTDIVIENLGLGRAGKMLTIAPGASKSSKMWDKENFVALVKTIGKEFDQILVLGSNNEQELCEYVAKQTGAVNIAGKLKLLDVCALLSTISLHIGNDSGVGHLAAAVGTKCIAIGDEVGPRCKPWQQHMILGDPKHISLEQVLDYLRDKKLLQSG